MSTLCRIWTKAGYYECLFVELKEKKVESNQKNSVAF